ncbi:hypothetical protein ACHAXH_003092 [Discostella pseudostelligera]
MPFRRHRRSPPSPRSNRMPLLLLLLPALILLIIHLPSPSLFFANAAIAAHELTDDAPPPPYDNDEEGYMGNIPLYLSYDIRHGEIECLYDKITTPHSYLTSSVYVLGNKDGFNGMRAVIVMEGPVAPAGFSLGVSSGREDIGGTATKSIPSGAQFQYHLDSYAREGGIKDEKAVRSVVIVDFEQAGEEGFYGYDDEEAAHAARKNIEIERVDEERNEERRILNEKRKAAEMKLEQLRNEAKLDDDFVKLQMDHDRANRPRQHPDNTEGEALGGGASPSEQHGRGRRLLEDTIKLSAGLPYERTIEITIPGWYRLCVGPPPSGEAISVEMELRSGSNLDPRTGHVLSIEETETHSEIHSLYQDEVSEERKAAIAASIIKDEDLVTTREQLRILERVYSEIIAKQLEERRTWNWRTIKNQKSYGHLVMGNFLETLAYMGITGWQVYTIRRWFGGGPTLGR